MTDSRPLPVGINLDVRPEEFDGVWMIRRVHYLAQSLGYARVRADRGESSPGYYYEVGYGPLFTVHLKTTPRDEVFQITKENWNSIEDTAIVNLLLRNTGEI